MALLTVLAEFAEVRVVTAMAAAAFVRDGNNAVHGWLTVTSVAVQPGVRPCQRKIGLRVVIEDPKKPVIGRMAGRAVVAKAALVYVVFTVTRDASLLRVEKRVSLVTIVTFDFGMTSEQRETGQIVIEADCRRETRLAVAAIAFLSELPLVRIIVIVAAETVGCRERNGDRIEMTFVAREICVRVVQRKLRVTLVIESDIEPLGRLMAIAAQRAVDPIVRIVLLVAIEAFGGEFLLVYIALMTRLAFEAPMPIDQRKPRHRSVVEEHFLPVQGRMAILALGSVGTHVRIVVPMAAHALLARALVQLVDVTAHTGNVVVRAGQHVTRLELMIEMRIAPFGLYMTIRALGTEVAHVLIVFEVARDALGLGAVKAQIRHMAVRAFHFCVTVPQRKVGKPVIEGILH